MPASPSAPNHGPLVRLSFLALCLAACGKHDSTNAKAPAVKESVPAPSAALPDTAPEVVVPDSQPAPASKSPSALHLAFTSHPPKAYLGKTFAYAPAVNFPGAVELKLAKPADSSMKLEKGKLTWTPGQAGRFPVILEAAIAASHGAPEQKAQQGFTLEVAPVVNLILKPLPAQAGKGDTVLFDLRGSSWPAWAASALTVRFDWDGDGKWDGEALPLPAHTLEKHAYPEPGRFTPRVEARYGSWETREAKGAISIVSAVTAVLKISPDTVEPGGDFHVDASASHSDGRLAYSLDIDGDGKADWVDSSSGQATLKAPASGVYQAKLTARNPMGQEGRAQAVLRVNARPKIEFRVRNAKDNMAANIEFKVRGKDADDSLRSVRINLTGDAKDWETRTAPDSGGGHEWLLRLKHVYGKVGQFAPSACATSADGREACQQLKVEIFNAPPVCQPGGDLHATLGKPMAIDGDGVDPDGKIVKWEWDLDGDGKYDLVSTENGKFQYTFSKEGTFKLVLRVTTADGMTATGSRKVEVRKKWKT